MELKQMCDYRNRVIGLANCKGHEWNRKIPGEPEDSESEASDTSEYQSDWKKNPFIQIKNFSFYSYAKVYEYEKQCKWNVDFFMIRLNRILLRNMFYVKSLFKGIVNDDC